MVHPYEKNSNTYNFFFHPLHKAEENPVKTVVAVIVNIALSIFSFCLWQIPFWTVNRLDHKKIELWNLKVKTEKRTQLDSFNPYTGKLILTQKLSRMDINSPDIQVSLPLEKTGRILHGNNTCFIATAIQLCRQLPSVRNALRSELKKNEWESEEKFNQRKLVHQQLKNIIAQTERGDDTPAILMNEFYSILHQYAPNRIGEPGNTGAVTCAFDCLLNVLSIPAAKYIFEDLPDEDPTYEKDLSPEMVGLVNKISDIKLEHSFKIEGNSLKKVSYHLVGVACFGSGHAFAYMKDIAHPSDQFVVFDDMQPHRMAQAIERNPTWPARIFLAVYIRGENS